MFVSFTYNGKTETIYLYKAANVLFTQSEIATAIAKIKGEAWETTLDANSLTGAALDRYNQIANTSGFTNVQLKENQTGMFVSFTYNGKTETIYLYKAANVLFTQSEIALAIAKIKGEAWEQNIDPNSLSGAERDRYNQIANTNGFTNVQLKENQTGLFVSFIYNGKTETIYLYKNATTLFTQQEIAVRIAQIKGESWERNLDANTLSGAARDRYNQIANTSGFRNVQLKENEIGMFVSFTYNGKTEAIYLYKSANVLFTQAEIALAIAKIKGEEWEQNIDASKLTGAERDRYNQIANTSGFTNVQLKDSDKGMFVSFTYNGKTEKIYLYKNATTLFTQKEIAVAIAKIKGEAWEQNLDANSLSGAVRDRYNQIANTSGFTNVQLKENQTGMFVSFTYNGKTEKIYLYKDATTLFTQQEIAVAIAKIKGDAWEQNIDANSLSGAARDRYNQIANTSGFTNIQLKDSNNGMFVSFTYKGKTEKIYLYKDATTLFTQSEIAVAIAKIKGEVWEQNIDANTLSGAAKDRYNQIKDTAGFTNVQLKDSDKGLFVSFKYKGKDEKIFIYPKGSNTPFTADEIAVAIAKIKGEAWEQNIDASKLTGAAKDRYNQIKNTSGFTNVQLKDSDKGLFVSFKYKGTDRKIFIYPKGSNTPFTADEIAVAIAKIKGEAWEITLDADTLTGAAKDRYNQIKDTAGFTNVQLKDSDKGLFVSFKYKGKDEKIFIYPEGSTTPFTKDEIAIAIAKIKGEAWVQNLDASKLTGHVKDAYNHLSKNGFGGLRVYEKYDPATGKTTIYFTHPNFKTKDGNIYPFDANGKPVALDILLAMARGESVEINPNSLTGNSKEIVLKDVNDLRKKGYDVKVYVDKDGYIFYEISKEGYTLKGVYPFNNKGNHTFDVDKFDTQIFPLYRLYVERGYIAEIDSDRSGFGYFKISKMIEINGKTYKVTIDDKFYIYDLNENPIIDVNNKHSVEEFFWNLGIKMAVAKKQKEAELANQKVGDLGASTIIDLSDSTAIAEISKSAHEKIEDYLNTNTKTDVNVRDAKIEDGQKSVWTTGRVMLAIGLGIIAIVAAVILFSKPSSALLRNITSLIKNATFVKAVAGTIALLAVSSLLFFPILDILGWYNAPIFADAYLGKAEQIVRSSVNLDAAKAELEKTFGANNVEISKTSSGETVFKVTKDGKIATITATETETSLTDDDKAELYKKLMQDLTSSSFQVRGEFHAYIDGVSTVAGDEVVSIADIRELTKAELDAGLTGAVSGKDKNGNMVHYKILYKVDRYEKNGNIMGVPSYYEEINEKDCGYTDENGNFIKFSSFRETWFPETTRKKIEKWTQTTVNIDGMSKANTNAVLSALYSLRSLRAENSNPEIYENAYVEAVGSIKGIYALGQGQYFLSLADDKDGNSISRAVFRREGEKQSVVIQTKDKAGNWVDTEDKGIFSHNDDGRGYFISDMLAENSKTDKHETLIKDEEGRNVLLSAVVSLTDESDNSKPNPHVVAVVDETNKIVGYEFYNHPLFSGITAVREYGEYDSVIDIENGFLKGRAIPISPSADPYDAAKELLAYAAPNRTGIIALADTSANLSSPQSERKRGIEGLENYVPSDNEEISPKEVFVAGTYVDQNGKVITDSEKISEILKNSKISILVDENGVQRYYDNDAFTFVSIRKENGIEYGILTLKSSGGKNGISYNYTRTGNEKDGYKYYLDKQTISKVSDYNSYKYSEIKSHGMSDTHYQNIDEAFTKIYSLGVGFYYKPTDLSWAKVDVYDDTGKNIVNSHWEAYAEGVDMPVVKIDHKGFIDFSIGYKGLTAGLRFDLNNNINNQYINGQYIEGQTPKIVSVAVKGNTDDRALVVDYHLNEAYVEQRARDGGHLLSRVHLSIINNALFESNSPTAWKDFLDILSDNNIGKSASENFIENITRPLTDKKNGIDISMFKTANVEKFYYEDVTYTYTDSTGKTHTVVYKAADLAYRGIPSKTNTYASLEEANKKDKNGKDIGKVLNSSSLQRIDWENKHIYFGNERKANDLDMRLYDSVINFDGDTLAEMEYKYDVQDKDKKNKIYTAGVFVGNTDSNGVSQNSVTFLIVEKDGKQYVLPTQSSEFDGERTVAEIMPMSDVHGNFALFGYVSRTIEGQNFTKEFNPSSFMDSRKHFYDVSLNVNGKENVAMNKEFSDFILANTSAATKVFNMGTGEIAVTLSRMPVGSHNEVKNEESLLIQFSVYDDNEFADIDRALVSKTPSATYTYVFDSKKGMDVSNYWNKSADSMEDRYSNALFTSNDAFTFETGDKKGGILYKTNTDDKYITFRKDVADEIDQKGNVKYIAYHGDGNTMFEVYDYLVSKPAAGGLATTVVSDKYYEIAVYDASNKAKYAFLVDKKMFENIQNNPTAENSPMDLLRKEIERNVEFLKDSDGQDINKYIKEHAQRFKDNDIKLTKVFKETKFRYNIWGEKKGVENYYWEYDPMNANSDGSPNIGGSAKMFLHKYVYDNSGKYLTKTRADVFGDYGRELQEFFANKNTISVLLSVAAVILGINIEKLLKNNKKKKDRKAGLVDADSEEGVSADGSLLISQKGFDSQDIITKKTPIQIAGVIARIVLLVGLSTFFTLTGQGLAAILIPAGFAVFIAANNIITSRTRKSVEDGTQANFVKNLFNLIRGERASDSRTNISANIYRTAFINLATEGKATIRYDEVDDKMAEDIINRLQDDFKHKIDVVADGDRKTFILTVEEETASIIRYKNLVSALIIDTNADKAALDEIESELSLIYRSSLANKNLSQDEKNEIEKQILTLEKQLIEQE